VSKAVESFLSASDKEAIKAAVREVESKTSGEIVPMVVPMSYSYSAAAMRAGLVLGGIMALVIAFLTGRNDMWSLSGLFIALYLIVSALAVRVHPLLRLFIMEGEMQEEVEEGALGAFYRNELYKTRDKTGVLIYISVFERKVWVLADSGINEKVDTGCWQEIVNIITKGIKVNKQGESICQAVRKCGDILYEHFPQKSDDSNELKNLIVEE